MFTKNGCLDRLRMLARFLLLASVPAPLILFGCSSSSTVPPEGADAASDAATDASPANPADSSTRDSGAPADTCTVILADMTGSGGPTTPLVFKTGGGLPQGFWRETGTNAGYGVSIIKTDNPGGALYFQINTEYSASAKDSDLQQDESKINHIVIRTESSSWTSASGRISVDPSPADATGARNVRMKFAGVPMQPITSSTSKATFNITADCTFLLGLPR